MDSPGTGNTHSNGTSSRARLVTSTDSCGLPASSRSSRPGIPSSRCSQLSRTSSVSRGASQPSTVSSLDRPWRSPRPSAAAIARATMAGSVTGTRSTYQAPSAYRPATSVTTLSASRVLPTPPGPTAVTRRCAASAAASSARSATRPTNEVNGRGQRHRHRGAEPTPPRAHGRRGGRQRPPVVHLKLAQQRGHVALHGPDRDEQPGGDLRVGQVLPDRGQHLSLAGRHTHPGNHRASTHTQILPENPAATPTPVTRGPSGPPRGEAAQGHPGVQGGALGQRRVVEDCHRPSGWSARPRKQYLRHSPASSPTPLRRSSSPRCASPFRRRNLPGRDWR